MMNLDHIDKQIISILQKKGRDSASHIAIEIGMSIPAVADRIRKLQEGKVITSFQAVVDPRMLGLDVSALITIISESSEHYNEVVESAKNTVEVIQCFTTTGNGSHVLIIQTENTRSLEKLLRQIQAWPGVMRTETQTILSNYK
jgi:Lrp/AsnC family leucine-responsive transcriptional regulator|tara:strand:- start:217 stop:648 length:432 start_codon:yes stop_codon:yes gene_type:complete